MSIGINAVVWKSLIGLEGGFVCRVRTRKDWTSPEGRHLSFSFVCAHCLVLYRLEHIGSSWRKRLGKESMHEARIPRRLKGTGNQ